MIQRPAVFVGIDVGASRTKAAVLDENRKLIGHCVVKSGTDFTIASNACLETSLEMAGVSYGDIVRAVSTGYGRKNVSLADFNRTEISCHARGANYFFPKARTIIDIGGQDSKIILVDEKGHVKDFVMNDRCAAGTGKFLEVTATTLETTIEELGRISQESTEKIDINSTCVVFAESEIIGLIAQCLGKPDIINAVHRSIAKRTKNLTAQLHWQIPVVFTGGVAKNTGMQRAISEIMGSKVIVPEDSFITGALGAAIFAKENLER